MHEVSRQLPVNCGQRESFPLERLTRSAREAWQMQRFGLSRSAADRPARHPGRRFAPHINQLLGSAPSPPSGMVLARRRQVSPTPFT